MDIIFVLLILISIIVGFNRGFINVFFKIIGIFLAILLAFATYKTVVNCIVSKTGLQDTIYKYVEKNINKEENNTSIQLPKIVDSFIDTTVIINQSKSSIIEKTTNFIVNAITIILLILIYYGLISIIRIILNNIFKLPVLNFVNKIGGSILESVKNIVMLLIVFSAINIVSVVTNVDGVIKFINNSIVCNYLYNHNPIDNIIVINQTKIIEKEEEGNEITNENNF